MLPLVESAFSNSYWFVRQNSDGASRDELVHTQHIGGTGLKPWSMECMWSWPGLQDSFWISPSMPAGDIHKWIAFTCCICWSGCLEGRLVSPGAGGPSADPSGGPPPAAAFDSPSRAALHYHKRWSGQAYAISWSMMTAQYLRQHTWVWYGHKPNYPKQNKRGCILEVQCFICWPCL